MKKNYLLKQDSRDGHKWTKRYRKVFVDRGPSSGCRDEGQRRLEDILQSPVWKAQDGSAMSWNREFGDRRIHPLG